MLCQRLNGPAAGWIAVHGRNRAADHRIAQSCEPIHAIRGQRLQIAPHDIDEHQLAQPAEHTLAAHPRFLGFGQGELHVGGQ